MARCGEYPISNISHYLHIYLFSVFCHLQLLCLIGEAFDHSDQICGAVVNIRGKSNKICE